VSALVGQAVQNEHSARTDRKTACCIMPTTGELS
jgi:hypothetical protein